MTRMLSIALLCLLPGFQLHAGDWPEWRGGPARDGHWTDASLPPQLGPAPLPIVWKVRLGTGFSGPSVSHGRVYVMDRFAPGTPDPSASSTAENAPHPDTERLLCLDAETGNIVWKVGYTRALKLKRGYENGPRATPTVADGKVYAIGAMGDFHCVDAQSGQVLWKKDLLRDYNARLPDWGVANAPLVESNLVVLQAGGRPGATVIAFHRDTGREVWRSLSDIPGYASIIAIDAGGRRQLIVWTADAICSLDPADGKVFWRHPRQLRWDQAIATPIYDKNLNLLLISSEREGTLALQLDRAPPGFHVEWDHFSLSCLHSCPVLVGDYIYGLNYNGLFPNNGGEFRCIKAATGELMWAATNVTKLAQQAQTTTTYNDGNHLFYLLNDQGQLILARATPEAYQEVGRVQLIGKTWTHPAFANHRIYARAERTLLCASLEATEGLKP